MTEECVPTTRRGQLIRGVGIGLALALLVTTFPDDRLVADLIALLTGRLRGTNGPGAGEPDARS